MDFENGVIVKIYKSKVDPILVWGRLRHPQTKMGISSGPMTERIIIAKLSPSSSLAGLIGFILNLHQISGGTSQISSGTSQISGGTSQISGGTS